MPLTTSRKTKKVSTTVRMNPEFKRRAEAFARKNNMSFSTFLLFSAQSTMDQGIKISAPNEALEKYAKELDEMIGRIDRGEEKAYGPFEGKEAIKFLESWM